MRNISSRLAGALIRNIKIGPPLLRNNCFCFAEQNPMLLDKGQLEMRNSDTFELKVFKVDPKNSNVTPHGLHISSASTLKQLCQSFKKQFHVENIKILSEQGEPFSQLTPVQALLDRFFTIVSSQYRIRIEGQLLHAQLDNIKQGWIRQLKQNLQEVEQPVIIQREIESYVNRVNTWLEAKYGFENNKLRAKEVQQILVQALPDPECHWSSVRQLEFQWRQEYFQLEYLKSKYEEAIKVSERMAKNRMYLDLVLIAGNIAFIGGGTYVVYSWDIIEPWAYFISSFAGIYLFRKAGKFRKPFSLQNYRSYLVYEVYLEKGAKEVGLDLQEFKNKQKSLQLIETTLKDYLITKL